MGTTAETSTPELNVEQVLQHYEQERSKRLRGDDALAQFIDVSLSDTFDSFQDDVWVAQDRGTIHDVKDMFPDNRAHVLIIGAGLGGMLYALRILQAGIKAEDIRIVDIAGGFGGTWYFNRYPGLSCDVESYLYLPWLEETGYMPKERYASGEEIRNYANLLAEKYGLDKMATFLTTAEQLDWDEEAKVWNVKLTQRKDKEPQTLQIQAQFLAMINGVLNRPKLPNIPGILDYQGEVFHSSRWDYAVTGGSPADQSLDKLKDKRVAVVGTGASAVQLVPVVAQWAKHLYVVQRTPSSVDVRHQAQTDSETFKTKIAPSKGWQRERHRNFHLHFTTGPRPEVDLVNDQWTSAYGLVGIAGNPDQTGPNSPDDLPAYMKRLHVLDVPRQERIRGIVDSVVSDPKVAEKLKPWYPSWCKRPAFHDEYINIFNRENVTLVDTQCKGVDKLTKDSFVVGGESYSVDLVIFATGFRPPYLGTPAEKANLRITGRNGVSMTDEWARSGPSTLHGVLDHNFPNLFLSGPWQASTSANFLFNDDELGKHVAYILTESKRRANGKPFAVAPTAEAVEEWGMQVLMNSAPMAVIMGCTPGYFNVEGLMDRAPPEEQMKMARSSLWGRGIESFLVLIEAWRDEGSMKGIEVRA